MDLVIDYFLRTKYGYSGKYSIIKQADVNTNIITIIMKFPDKVTFNLDSLTHDIGISIRGKYTLYRDLSVVIRDNEIHIRFFPIFQIHVITAMHVDDERRIIFCEYMIESLIAMLAPNLHVTHHISYYSDNPDHMEQIAELPDHFVDMNYHIKLYPRSSKHRQFEHIYSVLKEYKFYPDDTIMFFDDDDLMIAFPMDIYKLFYDTIDTLVGYQYVPNDSALPGDRRSAQYIKDQIEQGDLNFILSELPYQEHIWTKKVDFSGYTSKYNIIRSFLDQDLPKVLYDAYNPTILPGCTVSLGMVTLNTYDISMTTHLNTLRVIKPNEPFVFRRIWTHNREWSKFR